MVWKDFVIQDSFFIWFISLLNALNTHLHTQKPRYPVLFVGPVIFDLWYVLNVGSGIIDWGLTGWGNEGRHEGTGRQIWWLDRTLKPPIRHRWNIYLQIPNPASSILLIQSVLRKMWIILGYRLNFHKRECFSIYTVAQNITKSSNSPRFSKQGFKYFTLMVANMKSDYHCWSNILPKFLFVVQCLPVFLSKSD